MKTSKGKGKSNFSLSELALNDYESVFVIDAIDDSYVEYSASDSDTQLVVHGYGENFFLDVAENLRSQVWEEDRGYFIRSFNKAAIMQSLRSGRNYVVQFRLDIAGNPLHYEIRMIRSSDHSIILGIRNAEKQIQQELASEAERAAYMDIAESIAGLFDIIYHVDLTSGAFAAFQVGKNGSKPGVKHSGEDFFTQMAADAPNMLHPEDNARVLQALSRESLLASLEKSPTFTLSYRQLVNGETQHSDLLAFLQSDREHLVVCVRNVDAQKKQQTAEQTYSQIAGALASRYEVIYYIDVVTNAYTQYCSSEEFAQLGTPSEGSDFFAVAAADIRRYLNPDDVDRILNEMQKTTLLRNLNLIGTVMITYRQMLGGREQYVSALIVHPKNDARHIVMAIMNIDAQIRREMSMLTENQTFGEISKALAQRYEAIYHVNIETNEYTEYSASEKYARLRVGTKGTDFFGDCQRNMKGKIYPEDYPMMANEVKKQNLLDHLRDDGKYFLNYRLMLDGKPQYVTLFAVRPREDSSHVIVAVANMDAVQHVETDIEAAVGSAMKRANRDELTGVKNKRAYAQAEMELNEQIGEKTNPPFAVVVCDINGLKSVNDTQGQNAGDDYIKSACHIICDTFKHSPVFRVGGDEFTVLLKGSDYDHRKQLMQSLSIISLEHIQSGKVTMASGISDFNAMQDTNVQDVFERADSAMYENKKRFKSAFRR